MRIRKYLKHSPRNLVLIFLAAVLIWNEYLSVKISSLFWITPIESGKHYSILIVSDPQLIGYRNEKFGAIARWDSDRSVAIKLHFVATLSFVAYTFRCPLI